MALSPCSGLLDHGLPTPRDESLYRQVYYQREQTAQLSAGKVGVVIATDESFCPYSQQGCSCGGRQSSKEGGRSNKGAEEKPHLPRQLGPS